MRVHIYSQELTSDVELVETVADTGITYYGVRMYLASPDLLHHTDDDDDRSAVTFWIPNAASFGPHDLEHALRRMANMCHDVAENVPDNT